MAEKPKPRDEVYVEPGEFRRMRDPRTGRLKEVDMSLAALSRTMEQIRKGAEIINHPDTGFDLAMSRFEHIRELVLDHAQFSPKLQNLQIRIMNRTIEVVKNLEELDTLQKAYARNHFITKARAELAKTDRKSKGQRRLALEKAYNIMEKGLRYLEDDEETDKFIKELVKEMDGK